MAGSTKGDCMKSLFSQSCLLIARCVFRPWLPAVNCRVRTWLTGAVLVGSSVVMPAQAGGIADQPNVELFIDELVEKEGFDRQALKSLFEQVKTQDRIIGLMNRPAERSLAWWEYRDRFINNLMIQRGIEFWQQNREALDKAEKTYGIPACVITGILGVETHYGRFPGSFRVVDALSTLGFNYPRRAAYFQKQLKSFLILSREQGFDPLSLTGSYAGAMGIPQFMPSSYREYAVDFDNSGQVDIWKSPADAIGSVASYLNRHGWVKDQPVATRAKVKGKRYHDILDDNSRPGTLMSRAVEAGWTALQDIPASIMVRGLKLQGKEAEEYWLTMANFHVITRYNHSDHYAMAVYQLGKQLQSRYQEQLQKESQNSLQTTRDNPAS